MEDTEKFYSCLLGGIDEIAIVVASYRRPSYGSFVPTLVFVTSLDFMLSLRAQNQ